MGYSPWGHIAGPGQSGGVSEGGRGDFLLSQHVPTKDHSLG